MQTRRLAILALLAGTAAAAASTAGCAGDGPGPTSRPASDADRHQADILRDPMGYQPSISGNRSTVNDDDRGTLGHDLHSVFFP